MAFAKVRRILSSLRKKEVKTMPNIEMKAICNDLDKARANALRLGAIPLWKDSQVDTYFHTKAGKLKLRESGENGAELLPYIKTEQAGLKRSDYAKIPISDPILVKSLLEELLGKRLVVKKTREVLLIGNIRVHLDEVEGLGKFLEFEAVFEMDTPENRAREAEKVARLMVEFDSKNEDLIQCSYPELLDAANTTDPDKIVQIDI